MSVFPISSNGSASLLAYYCWRHLPLPHTVKRGFLQITFPGLHSIELLVCFLFESVVPLTGETSVYYYHFETFDGIKHEERREIHHSSGSLFLPLMSLWSRGVVPPVSQSVLRQAAPFNPTTGRAVSPSSGTELDELQWAT